MHGLQFLVVVSLTGCATPAQPTHDDGPGSLFGQSLAVLGDVDGDGIPDVVVGCPRIDEGDARLGRAYVVSTKKGRALFAVDDGVPGSCFGDYVAAVGDRNGDGIVDFEVSAPWTKGGCVVRTYSGRDGALLSELRTSHRRYPWRPRIVEADFDGDGIEDRLEAHVEPIDDRSRLVAYSGRTGKEIREWKQRGTWTFGSAFDVVGDVDGDGTPDVVVTAPQCSMDESWAWILSGRGDWSIHTHFETWVSAEFGVSCCGIGDVDGDHVPDYLVGEASYRAGASFPGHVHLYSGKTGEEIACWSQESVRSRSR